MATHSSIPCLGNPMDRGAWWAYSPWSHKRAGRDLATKQQQQVFPTCTKGNWLLIFRINCDYPSLGSLLLLWFTFLQSILTARLSCDILTEIFFKCLQLLSFREGPCHHLLVQCALLWKYSSPGYLLFWTTPAVSPLELTSALLCDHSGLWATLSA